MNSDLLEDRTSDIKIAVMQPYLFPYLPYFQLIRSVDKFVLYDDVNYIKKGWVNRNALLGRNGVTRFTLPVSGASQNKKILEIEINWNEKWIAKFKTTLRQAYGKAPFFDSVYPEIENILSLGNSNLSEFVAASLQSICKIMGIDTEIITSSSSFDNAMLKGQERILDICKKMEADTYINAINGREIYCSEHFKSKNVRLRFLRPRKIEYRQHTNTFIENLSILDVLMFNSPDTTARLLDQYDLIK